VAYCDAHLGIGAFGQRNASARAIGVTVAIGTIYALALSRSWRRALTSARAGWNEVKPLFATAFSLACALGRGTTQAIEALRAERGGLRRNDFLDSALDTWIGSVEALRDDGPISRVHQITQAGLDADDFGVQVERARDTLPADRIGVFIGTSSSGMLQGELAYRKRLPESGALPADLRYRDSFNMYAPADYLRAQLALAGPASVISTACSSGAKVFAAAHRAIEAGLCDAAVVGGVETLCFTTLHGFASLDLLSREPCRPCDAERAGISLGEGAAFVLLEKTDVAGEGLALLGYGESADAHHMSTPHPEGRCGACNARRADRAGVTANEG
jgi:3-oxoacyl-[acyl-carrier-protein] synthase-1